MGFRFMCTLTALHMVVTDLALRLVSSFGVFERRALPPQPLWRMAVLTALVIGLFNLSLQANTVGFYQMSKLAVAPATVGYQYAAHGKRASPAVMRSLAVLLLGLGVSSVTDLTLNALGLAFSCGAVASTVIQQLLVGELQRTYSVSSSQLLAASALPTAAVIAVVGVPVDYMLTGGHTALDFPWSLPLANMVALSSAWAIAVNMSAFFVIGATSALTYQVTGHLKTILVLLFGFTVLGDPVNVRCIIGMGIAIVGMAMYTRASLAEKEGDGAKKEVGGAPKDEDADARARLLGDVLGDEGGGAGAGSGIVGSGGGPGGADGSAPQRLVAGVTQRGSGNDIEAAIRGTDAESR